MTHSSARTYPASGEGLRDAVKNGDLDGVRKLLATNPELSGYRDRQAESMLHLAAIFNHTEIALALVDAGADPHLKNVANETALDVAFPTLKAKITARFDERQK